MIPTENLTITIPISQSARQTATQFAQEQPTAEKATRVYFNTLAVLVVHDYLQILEIPTELKASYSWNRIGRICADLADLKLTGVGHLECRPVKVNQRTCSIPAEVWQDRIGCVVVQLNETEGEGILLGFMPSGVQQLSIDRLQPVEALLVRLHQPTFTMVQLSQWFDNIFESGWHGIEEILNSKQALAFRHRNEPATNRVTEDTGGNTIRRAKRIDLGIRLADCSIALLVELEPKGEETNILLQIYPTNSFHLPSGLQLDVLDDLGTTSLQQVQARNADNYIQLQFMAAVGEQFGIRITLKQASITEYFRV